MTVSVTPSGTNGVETTGYSRAGVVDSVVTTVSPGTPARATCCSVVGKTAESVCPAWAERRLSSGTTRLSIPPMPARASARWSSGSRSISARPTMRAMLPTVDVDGSGTRASGATIVAPHVVGSGA